jgi:hypothetical protein
MDYNDFLRILEDNTLEAGYTPIIFNATIEGNRVYVVLKNQEVGFCFSFETGKLLFIYNWKD